MPTPQKQVKLVCGLIAASSDLLAAAEEVLVKRFGLIDARSETIPFTFTGYYAPEMGEGLVREWVGFERLILPGDLAAIKLATNGMEGPFARSGKRTVNIDPGYLTQANLILASTKDFSHRIYLGHGIYGEVTLIFRRGAFEALPWTYPDYQSPAALQFLAAARDRYRAQLAEPSS